MYDELKTILCKNCLYYHSFEEGDKHCCIYMAYHYLDDIESPVVLTTENDRCECWRDRTDREGVYSI